MEPKARAKFLKGMISENTRKMNEANDKATAAREKLVQANKDHEEYQKQAAESRNLKNSARGEYEAAMEASAKFQGEVSKLSGELSSLGEV